MTRIKHLRRLIVGAVDSSALIRILLIPVLLISLSGCAIDRLLTSSDPVEGAVIDLSDVKTRNGAIRFHRSVMVALTSAFAQVSYFTAVFTDEMTKDLLSTTYDGAVLDARKQSSQILPGVLADNAYNALHIARVNAAQAITLLQRYGIGADSALIGEAYAAQAQTIVYLGEMFCSGIPLTRAPFDGGLEYTRGMSTAELFQTAAALFDTAIAYAGDSVRVASLAKIGKGRALMNLGLYDQALNVVRDVETSYTYSLRFSSATGGVTLWTITTAANPAIFEVGNGEGENGIDWTSTPGDPRVPFSTSSPHRQQKVLGTSVLLPMAKGIEARMIEAEALLQPPNSPAGDWLGPINSARATVGLAALTDPGTADSRIDMVFNERAYWNFLEGHRLADYRRLVRQYERLPMNVYPYGIYTQGGWSVLAYENNYVFSPPRNEEERNHLYTGCIDLNP